MIQAEWPAVALLRARCQLCTFRALISLSCSQLATHKPQTESWDRRLKPWYRASLLLYKTSDLSQTLYPKYRLDLSWHSCEILRSPGQNVKIHQESSSIPEIWFFETIINYPKNDQNQIWSIKTPLYIFITFFPFSTYYMNLKEPNFFACNWKKNWYNFT